MVAILIFGGGGFGIGFASKFIESALYPLELWNRYDVVELSKCGFNAVGVDLSTTAVAAAKDLSSTIAVAELRGTISYYAEDILSPSNTGAVFGKKFDLIYDYTFLCALDPSLRARWASTMKGLLKPDGELVTLIYPLGDYEGGPPYAMSVGLVRGLLEAVGFEPFYLEPVAEALSHPGREGREALGRWRLRS